MSTYRQGTRTRVGGTSWKDRRKEDTIKCSNCETTSTAGVWKKKSGEKGVLCQTCFVGESTTTCASKRSATPAVSEDGDRATPPLNKHEKVSPTSSEGSSKSVVTDAAGSAAAARRASRRQASLRHQAITAAAAAGGVGAGSGLAYSNLLPGRPGFSFLKNRGGPTSRRGQIFKSSLRPPTKAPTRRATVSTSEVLWHNELRYEVGDIVSLEDEDDGQLYFAQIRGFVTDEYAEKFAVLTWLLPSPSAPQDNSFQPSTYFYGPNDERLYPMDTIEFHCHASTPNLRWKWNPAEYAQLTSQRDMYKDNKTLSVQLE